MVKSGRRPDGRRCDELRPFKITQSYLRNVEGAVLIEMGGTHVICTATVEETVPPFLRGKNKGWVTAEYGMLPRSSRQRIPRESVRGRVAGRTQEIQRLIGRSIRAVIDLEALGERTVTLDCDVIQADGGTRTASITGAFVALADALEKARSDGRIQDMPLKDYIAAISVGRVDGRAMLDLCYEEDSRAEVDMNIVMTGSGRFVEVQGTAEQNPFSRAEMDGLMTLAGKGIRQLVAHQEKLLKWAP